MALGSIFRRHSEGYRFAKLACDIVEKHDFIESQAKVYASTALAAASTQSIATAIDFNRKSIRAASETGDPIIASFGTVITVYLFFLRNDPLDMVWRESEMAQDFARKSRIDEAADMINANCVASCRQAGNHRRLPHQPANRSPAVCLPD